MAGIPSHKRACRVWGEHWLASLNRILAQTGDREVTGTSGSGWPPNATSCGRRLATRIPIGHDNRRTRRAEAAVADPADAARPPAATPVGLSTPELTRLATADIESWTVALTRCREPDARAETAGHVKAAGTLSDSATSAIIWQITDAGRVKRRPSVRYTRGDVRSLFLALGVLGGTATTTTIRLWLAAQDERLTASRGTHRPAWPHPQRTPPLTELARRGRPGRGQPDLWKLTRAGCTLLAEDET